MDNSLRPGLTATTEKLITISLARLTPGWLLITVTTPQKPIQCNGESFWQHLGSNHHSTVEAHEVTLLHLILDILKSRDWDHAERKGHFLQTNRNHLVWGGWGIWSRKNWVRRLFKASKSTYWGKPQDFVTPCWKVLADILRKDKPRTERVKKPEQVQNCWGEGGGGAGKATGASETQ